MKDYYYLKSEVHYGFIRLNARRVKNIYYVYTSHFCLNNFDLN